MVWQYIYIILVFGSALTMAALTVYAWRNRERPGAFSFGWMTLSVAAWALVVGFLYITTNLSVARTLWYLSFTTILTTALAFLWFAFDYTGQGRWLTRRYIVAILIVPVATQFILWTNPIHESFVIGETAFRREGILLVWTSPSAGPWFWVHTAYNYLVVAIALLLIITAAVRSLYQYRWQALALLAGAFLPILFTIFSTFELIPSFPVSLVPISFTLTCLIFGWAIFRYQLLEISPIARSRLVDTMSDGMLVVDLQGRITDLNPAMHKILVSLPESKYKRAPQSIIGKPVDQTLEFFKHFLEEPEEPADIQTEIKLDQDGVLRYFDLRISPLMNSMFRIIGELIVLRDISARIWAEQALEAEREKSERLLLNILPVSIAGRLKDGEQVISDRVDSASVLFADIVGFTPFSETLSAIELVDFLNRIFSSFDGLVDKYGLEKIKTIGDGYMVVGGVPEPMENHAETIAYLALEMLREFEFQAGEQPNPLQLRIGINSGPLVAGVIGRKKFAYDLWGDTVTIASRMEYHSLPGRIQVTESTFELLKTRFIFEERGQIEVRGRGLMPTWFLVGKML